MESKSDELKNAFISETKEGLIGIRKLFLLKVGKVQRKDKQENVLDHFNE